MIRTISHDRLKQLVDYDPLTGVFRWRNNGRGYWAGQIVGGPKGNGYIEMRVGGLRVLAHRLAWFYEHGEWPPMIDHIDGNPTNNAISNLRVANYSQQNANLRRRSDNTSGTKGVCYDRSAKRWRARVNFNGRAWCRDFGSKDEAVKAVREMREQIHGEFARHA